MQGVICLARNNTSKGEIALKHKESKITDKICYFIYGNRVCKKKALLGFKSFLMDKRSQRIAFASFLFARLNYSTRFIIGSMLSCRCALFSCTDDVTLDKHSVMGWLLSQSTKKC